MLALGIDRPALLQDLGRDVREGGFETVLVMPRQTAAAAAEIQERARRTVRGVDNGAAVDRLFFRIFLRRGEEVIPIGELGVDQKMRWHSWSLTTASFGVRARSAAFWSALVLWMITRKRRCAHAL